MCGIVGYIGNREATPVLINGLAKLEYRGYDSAGIAVFNGKELEVHKYKGRLNVLAEKVSDGSVKGHLGIGHTRWATHGAPSDMNSHPHRNMAGDICVVHNGIIENYQQIKEWLISLGYQFTSETDTEVMAHLVSYYYEGDLEQAARLAVKKVEGSYAFVISSSKEADKLIVLKKDNPLVLGLGQGENFIASDIPAIIEYTRDIYILEDKEMAVITKDGITIKDYDGNVKNREVFKVTWDVEAAEKGGYSHFMEKEIYEQPKAIRDTLRGRIDIEKRDVILDDIKITGDDLKNISKVFIVACGTAYHAGLIGKYTIEKFAGIPVEVDVASEFRYREPLVDNKTLFIAVSQSGETADTLAAMREAKKLGARVIAVTNAVGSTISREAQDVLYTWAGPEIAVASTKAYVTQQVSMYLIGLKLGLLLGKVSNDQFDRIANGLKDVDQKVARVLDQIDKVKLIAEKIKPKNNLFFLGRGLDYLVAMEGSLKLKEISYIHSEAYAAGELKHGTIALIEEGMPVIALATQEHLFEKMLSNIKEVKARGAWVVTVAMEGHDEAIKAGDHTLFIPKVEEEIAPIVTVIPLQLLSYYTAIARDCDVDKPRNLAKSVTVE